MCFIESIYIYNNRNICILKHPGSSTAISGTDLITAYLSRPAPRPPAFLLPNQAVPTVVYSISRDDLLLVTPVTREAEPLEVLELLHSIFDILEDFLGVPLLPAKIQDSYDLVGQILGEIFDGGLVAVTESNAIQDIVTRPGWMEKLFSGVGLPASVPSIGSSTMSPGIANLSLKASDSNEMPTPWRRSNVRHTTNKMTIDMVETIDAIFAPSGRPLTAHANGSIAFTCEVSGVPDVILTLAGPGGKASTSWVGKTIQNPVFHPCVRLSRWKSRPGELSFIPPDGRFILAGYESDLLGPDHLTKSVANPNYDPGFHLPVTASLHRATDLNDKWGMEIHLTLDPDFLSSTVGPGSASTPIVTVANRGGGGGGLGSSLGALGASLPSPSMTSLQRPTIDEIVVHVPVPARVRNFADVRASVGEAFHSYPDERLQWKISAKEVAGLLTNRRSSEPFVAATLRCTIVTVDGLDGAGAGGDDQSVIGEFENPRLAEYRDDEIDDVVVAPGDDNDDDDNGIVAPAPSNDTDGAAVSPFEANPWNQSEDLITSPRRSTTNATPSPAPEESITTTEPKSELKKKKKKKKTTTTEMEGEEGEKKEKKKKESTSTGKTSKLKKEAKPKVSKSSKAKLRLEPAVSSSSGPRASTSSTTTTNMNMKVGVGADLTDGRSPADESNLDFFPTVASVQFQITGWLASGVRVGDLTFDPRRSRGVGAGLMPTKRVKYVSTAGTGVEIRCGWRSRVG